MVYLVLHGETEWNLLKRCNGITETFLNATGIEQAKVVAELLKGVELALCYCSTQRRARQFCELIYKGEVRYEERLCEIDCGEFEGMEETPEMMKLFWQAIQIGDKGTEDLRAFIKRNCDLCDSIEREFKGKNILIVTHAANARVIDYYFNGKPDSYDFSKRVVEKGQIITYAN